MKKFIGFLLCAVMLSATMAFADGFLDKEKGTNGSSIQFISPSPTYGIQSALLISNPYASTKFTVTALKLISFAASSVTGAAIPVKVWLYNKAGTITTKYFTHPSGFGTISIGPDVSAVAFGHISSTTYTDKVTMWGR
jgi:1,4-dihydroxy-2-naphthoate octaprenyltransferase